MRIYKLTVSCSMFLWIKKAPEVRNHLKGITFNKYLCLVSSATLYHQHTSQVPSPLNAHSLPHVTFFWYTEAVFLLSFFFFVSGSWLYILVCPQSKLSKSPEHCQRTCTQYFKTKQNKRNTRNSRQGDRDAPYDTNNKQIHTYCTTWVTWTFFFFFLPM